jgi:hypothetical protein
MRFKRDKLFDAILATGLLALMISIGCATTQVQKSRHVSVDVHAVLAAVDDAEMALCNKGVDGECKSLLPAWTTEKHRDFSAHMVVALKAGRAVNEAVRTLPTAPDGKANLAIVSAELENLTAIVKDALPANSTVTVALTAAKDAVLALLPLFLS